MNTNSPKINFKKVIAKESIFIIIVAIIFILLYLLQNKLDKRYDKNIKEIEAIEDQIPPKQMLWYNLMKAELYKKNYTAFKKDYNNTEDQINLFYLVKNNSLLPKDYEVSEYPTNCDEINEFRSIVFYSDYILERCFRHFYDDSFNSCAVDNLEWITLSGGKEKFIEKLRDDRNLKKIYKSFLDGGYDRSFEELKKNIFNNIEKEILKDNFGRLELLKTEINENGANHYYYKFQDIYWFIFILVFPLRYLILIIKWSIIQLKNK